MAAKKVCEHVTEQLHAWGVKRIYGVAGDALFPWLDVLGKQREITFIPCRHESAAAMMAAAEAKLTGLPAVCAATSGPGLLNLLNGLQDAQTDRVPVVAITGQVESYKRGGGYKQYIPQEALLAPLLAFTAEVTHPKAIGEMMQKAFVMAVERKGAAHLAVCKDVWTQPAASPMVSALPPLACRMRLDRAAAEQGAELVNAAKRPVFLAGVGARPFASLVQRLAERIGAAILLSLGAKGAIPDAHPQVLGGLGDGGSEAGLQALAEADLLVILGATWFPKSYIPARLPIIQVDENREAFHPVDHLLPVPGDLEETLLFWEDRLPKREPDREWLARVISLHRERMKELERISLQSALEKVKPERLMTALDQIAAPDAIIALDTGEHTVWFNRAFRAAKQQPLFSGKWRTMGYGLPAAISAKLAFPDREVIAIVGDGGLMMNAGELVTLAQLGLPVTAIVVNNGAFGLEEVKMKRAGLTPFATRLVNPDFTRLAQACGLASYRVDAVRELEETLREAVASRLPALVEISATPPTLTPLRRDLFQAQA
ncbi:thiamine pyrophosphate-binding protein [Brevibacillus sp. SYP-B805]|uniref:thiamine pyrophosphate-binding protein n=1 Tax=Brevibacillus sp. SYP-B805 TaxID=1578199 RepID=UPI0013EC7C7E|nr:thiamine pyrophosphate-binding protein [Brevibacillus sp. SYP-B805]NGQ94766.1 thiamine pyrophosphate-binding protein [Brevibacillus sp. SYP-B805]